MQHLSAAQLGTLRGMLEREATELQSRISDNGQEVALSSNDGEPRDMEDFAAEEATRFRANNLLVRDRARYEEVLAALKRIDEGGYGICEETDEPIPYRRLEIDPAVRYTAEAQAELEREQAERTVDPHGEEPIAY